MLQTFLPQHSGALDRLSADRRIKPHVMVVADASERSEPVVSALRREGFDVTEATTGAQALALLAELPLDVVVLDDVLADVDGYALCRQLKDASLGLLPILHLSDTSAPEEARERGLEAGADVYLIWPCHANVLRAAASTLVRLKRQDSAHLAQSAATSLLQQALDSLGDHVALLDPDSNIVAVNTAWERFAAENGYADGGSGVGLNYCNLCERVSGADRDAGAAIAQGIREVIAGDVEQFQLEYPCHSPTEQRWFRVTVRRVLQHGPVAAIITHSDCTAERRRGAGDALFRRFVETAQEGVIAMDFVGRITYGNKASGVMLGCRPGELVGRAFFDFLATDGEQRARTHFSASWDGESHRSIEVQICREDGTTVELLAAETPMRDEDGQVVGVLALLTDITLSNAAQRSITNAMHRADADRRRLEATLEALPVGVWLADATGALTHANPAVDRIWGGVAPPVSGMEEYGKYSATWPATGAAIAPHEWALARTLATGETITGEMVRIDRFDGTHGFVLNSSAPIRDADGRITGGVVVNVDITAQQAEVEVRERLVASLERERAHLSAVFAQAPAFFAIARGPNHVFERVNNAYQLLIGNRQVIGRAAAEAVPEIVEQGLIALLDNVRATGVPFVGRQLPLRLARTPGEPLETRYTDFVYQRLDDPDGDHALIAHGVDITDQVRANRQLRESEARQREQFAKLPVPTWLWEWRGDGFVLLDCNDAAAESLPNYSPDLIGKAHNEIFGGPPEVSSLLLESLQSNAVIRRTVEVAESQGLGRRTLEFTVGPQQPDRVLVHVIDTTERVGLEAQLRQAQKMEAVGQLAGGVAHDFNNLLTVIGAHASFLLETLEIGDPQREDADAIQKAGVRAAALTRQLLAFSRQQILKPQVIDLNAVVADTHQMLARLLGEDVQTSVSLAHDLPRIVADPGQIEQVLINLAVNARDAMPGGGPLSISTRLTIVDDATHPERGVPAGSYVTLEVRDTGTGMSADVQAHIFEPFFTTKATGQGTGLGLAMVYGIVKQSAGFISVSSTLGEGTAFRVMLPAVAEGEQDEQLQEAERAAARGIETVLLVEDEDAIRRVAARMLERLGYVVLNARNGADALSISAAFDAPIHLVITDAVMPGMTGAETARRLQESRPALKVLFMSGYTDDEVMRRGVVSSSVRFVQKPFSAAGLGRAVREALED